jgi:glycosyltransferase involved in cell wall biosynthesis
MDIKPKGFSVIELDGYVNAEQIRLTRKVLENKAFREQMVNKNYEIASRWFSYAVLKQKLQNLIFDCVGCNPKNRGT